MESLSSIEFSAQMRKTIQEVGFVKFFAITFCLTKNAFSTIFFYCSHVVIDTLDRHVVLKELYPFTIYEIFLMTSTHGGSVNGFTVTVKTTSIGMITICN